MDVLKRLFCKHDYKCSCGGIKIYGEPDFSNTWQEYYTEYICTKCGKKKTVYKIK